MQRDLRESIDVRTPAHEALVRDSPREEAQKSYHTVLEQHIQQAQEDIVRPAGGLLLSSFSAGLDIGFGPFLMAVIATLTGGAFARPVTEILMALAYTSGFVLVIVGRSALFTEQTTSAVLPVLARRVAAWRLLRLWSLVLVGNLVAGALIAIFVSQLGERLGIVDASALAAIADKLVRPSWTVMLSAIAAGWLMGLLAWLVVASRETTSQILIIVIVTFVIGIAGLHHSIAGAVELLMAVFANAGATLTDYGRVISLSVIGNAIGGAVFVALLKFGHVHASRSQ